MGNAAPVVFDPVAFIGAFPSFTSVPALMLQFNFDLACLQLDNTPNSPVWNQNTRQMLLWLLTAHLTALLNGVNGEPPPGMVGRLANAAEGSVSAATVWDAQTSSQLVASLQQTQWGVQYLAATASLTGARYMPAPCQPNGGVTGPFFFVQPPGPWCG
jgi:hypothetical protein